MKIKRRKTRLIKVGSVEIGGEAPISIQSMTKCDTTNIPETIRQIRQLKDVGCDIVRVAVNSIESAKAIKEIKKKIDSPIVADIHFNYQFAIEAIKSGIDKIRLNPGNIYKLEEIKQVVALAKKYKVPIRIGLNSGSVKKKYTSMVDSMVFAAKDYLKILEGLDFFDIVISLKCSNILDTIEAYRKMSKICDYPFHLGLTATGFAKSGVIKSSIGIGALLLEGIGDTIRVSLTSQPMDEVLVAKEILQSLGLRKFFPEVISCPTCGRCSVDLIKIVNNIQEQLVSSYSVKNKNHLPTLAIMGCFVNGPGEASIADLGIAFGKKTGLIFKKGKVIKRLPQDKAVDFLLKEIK